MLDNEPDFSQPLDSSPSSANEDYQYTINDCWYCRLNHNNSPWYFSCEFDCYLHEECLRQEILENKPEHNNKELDIITKELLGMTLEEAKEKFKKEETF